jgi:hypothetical protein
MQTYQFTANGGPNILIENALGVSNQTMPSGIVGAAYSHTFLPVNGAAPYTFSVVSGSFPVGLTMNSSGAVSGTPTTAGSFSPPVIQVQSA